MKRYFLLISILLLPVVQSLGQHSVMNFTGGTITTSVTWNSYDTIYITGALNILPGGNLTIAPNTSGNDIGTYVIFTGDWGINIAGSGVINVNGTISERIFFTADRPETSPLNLPLGDKTFGEAGERSRNISFVSSTGTSVIDHAVIEYGAGNITYGLGGGVLIITSDNITISNSEIRNNSAPVGGGIATSGGNPYTNIILTDLSVHDNLASFAGGFYMDIPVPIERCEIYNNYSEYHGSAGVYLSRTVTVSNSLIYNNTSGTGYSASAVWVNASGSLISNCIIYGHTIGVQFQSSGDVINSTIVNNGTGVVPVVSTIMLNSILWGNTTAQYTGSNISFGNCGIEGGIVGGTDGGGNLNLNSSNTDPAGPNFVNPASDFHIGAWNNPLYNAGANSYGGLTATTTDYDNRSRISTVDIGAYEFIYYSWLGTTSTDASVSSNWLGAPSPIPTDFAGTQILIPDGSSNWPTFATLTLSSGSRAIVDPSARLTVSGATTVNSGCTFTLRSGSAGSANFITGSSVSGSFNVELYLAGSSDPTYNWHYVTSPVDGHSKTALQSSIGNTNNLLNYLESAVTTADRMLGWQWHDGFGGDTQFDNLYTNQGYNVLLRNLSSRNATFTGTILPGQDITFTSTELTVGTADAASNGWHLIGNPYTAGIDLEAMTFGTNVEPTVYYTSGNSFATWNTFTQQGTGSFATRYIPGMQGFFVHVTSGSGRTLTIPASARLYSGASILKSGRAASEYPMLKFNISDGSSSTDEALVYFFDDAEYTFDGKYDAYKLLSENPAIPQIYTTLNNVKYSMNGLPLPDQKTVVPVNITIPEARNYTIKVLNLDNLDDYTVTLVDGDKKVDLKTNPAYTFYAAKGTITNMSVIFENALTSVTVPEKDQTELWYSNGAVRIKAGVTGFEDNSAVIIYDLSGKVVFRRNNVSIGQGEIIEIPVNLQRGIFVTSVINNNKKLVKKIVITK